GAMASAAQNNSPMLVLGGRAPAFRWGQGSLQEIDHVPFVAPVVKHAATAQTSAEIPALMDAALRAAVTPHSGPAFIDFPLDQVFGESPAPAAMDPLPEPWTGPGAEAAAIDRAAALLRDAERPVIMAGTGLYWGRGEEALHALARELRVPVFLNGLGRGCVPADDELAFSRARSAGLGGADVAVVIGVPLGFGPAFAQEADVISIAVAEPPRSHPRQPAAELYGALPATLQALRAGAGGRAGASPDRTQSRDAWVASLRDTET